jgi:ferredoxin
LEVLKILTLYFSGTGNTKYIADLFSKKMGADCFSIEDNDDFANAILSHDAIVVCYPIYGSRIPLIMREFIARHMEVFKGKKLIIFVTQLTFSGDGARVLCDLFPKDYIEVIYAEHFFMPNNVCNFALLRQTSDKSIQKRMKTAEVKINKICRRIKEGKVKKRGFSLVSRLLGKVQGKPWQGDSRNPHAAEGTMEYKAKHGVRIDEDCISCNACVHQCPMKNLENNQEIIVPKDNCTMCYRCVNLCPKRAITVFFHKKPKWQYKSIR